MLRNAASFSDVDRMPFAVQEAISQVRHRPSSRLPRRKRSSALTYISLPTLFPALSYFCSQLVAYHKQHEICCTNTLANSNFWNCASPRYASTFRGAMPSPTKTQHRHPSHSRKRASSSRLLPHTPPSPAPRAGRIQKASSVPSITLGHAPGC